jgi:hypothetical protein
MSKVIASISYVSDKNTPESDLMPLVMHTVEGYIQETRQAVKIHLKAECPMDALERASKMDSSMWNA